MSFISFFYTQYQEVSLEFDAHFQDISKISLVLLAGSIAWIMCQFKNCLNHDIRMFAICSVYSFIRLALSTRIGKFVFKQIRRIPLVRNKIENEISKVNADLIETIHKVDKTGLFLDEIPCHGRSKADLLDYLQNYVNFKTPQYLNGRVSGAVFSNESDAEELALYQEIFAKFAYSNPLWPKLFPGVRKMEAEVIRMCCSLMNGDEQSCGSMSTGGTMSILLACMTYRNKALEKGVLFPEMIVPTSVHAAFIKAAELFRMKLILIPVDNNTFKVDLRKMKAAITSNTAMLVGSAPSFPFGTIDDIEGIAELGLKYKVPVHVDACCGGFILPFIDENSYGIKPWDFRVAGVTSISADTHKYGLAPKGNSVVLYRNKDLIHYQYFCDTNWQGGIYASATMEGSRSGLNIALAWSSLLYYGKDKYQQTSKAVVDTTRKIRDGIKAIPELELQGASDVCIVSLTSTVVDIHRFHHILEENGWYLTSLQFPSGVHLMVTLNHTKNNVAEDFLACCRLAVAEIVSNPFAKLEGAAALYGMSQKIPDRSIIREFANGYLDACYSSPIPL
uniref:Sphingosine-1-phosphate lyase 1 n=1 Tax=Rhabditophanes sp. KR3021 TaxID=114890 RepID=A0AC35TL28_9BILA